MKLFSLALRNVLRNRRRTAITLGTIGVAAAAIVVLGGFVSATLKGLQTLTVRNTGHLQVMAQDALALGRAAPAHYAIHDPQAVAALLEGDAQLQPMLRVVTPVLQVQGVAGRFESGLSSTFSATGWDAQARDAMLAWDGLGLQQPPQRSGLQTEQPEAGTIGTGLAQLLGLCAALQLDGCVMPRQSDTVAADAPAIAADLAELAEVAQRSQAAAHALQPPVDGTTEASPLQPAIELLAASSAGAPNVVRMQVASAQPQGVRELDMVHVGLPLPLAQRLVFGPDSHGATALVVQLHASAQLAAAQARIEQLLTTRVPGSQPLQVHAFTEIQPSYGQIVRMFSVLLGFVALLMLVVTLFSVANTVNMAISERTAEIGTLRAIGLRQREIRHLFLAEGGLLGVLGAGAGVLAAVLLALGVVNRAGLRWTPPSNSAAVPIHIDIGGSVALCLGTVLAMALIACLSAWWPAHRASRQPIVEALRHA